MKKCLVMPDSFKGTIDSIEVCDVMESIIKKHRPSCQVEKYPIADGGEGTVDCFLHALPNGKKVIANVSDPFGKTIEAHYGRFGNTSIIETATAAGLSLCSIKDPLIASTYGLGQLIHDAIKNGSTKVILGLGGSCTNDGGAGMASALGVKFFDENDKEFIPSGGTLCDIKKIDTTESEDLLQGISIFAMCDIENPMYGPNGASYIFAPQKGATEEMLPILDNNMRYYVGIISKEQGIDLSNVEGSGAAGGLGGGAFAFLNAKLERGIDLVLDLLEFEDKLKDCDMVFTGEGKLDQQTLNGKVVLGISKRAQKMNVPVTVIAGTSELDLSELSKYGVRKIYTTTEDGLPQGLSNDELNKYCVNKLSSTMEKVVMDI